MRDQVRLLPSEGVWDEDRRGNMARTRRPRARMGLLLLLLPGLLISPPFAAGERDEPLAAAAEEKRKHLLPFGVRGVGREATAEKRETVAKGLRWLAAHQAPDGRFAAREFGSWCDGKDASSQPAGRGKSQYDVGVTGIVTLAFLHAGYDPATPGPYGELVRRAVRWLQTQQDATGCLGRYRGTHFVYNHAYAATALVEAYGMSGEDSLRSAAELALAFSTAARNPHQGWRYGVRSGDNDTSVTGAMIGAFKAAALVNDASAKAGVPRPFTIDEEVFSDVRDYVRRMTGSFGGRIGYQWAGGPSARDESVIEKFGHERTESMTAVGLHTRIACGDDPRQDERMKEGIRLLGVLPPKWDTQRGRIDLYYWWYGSLVAAQVGATLWDRWAPELEKALLEGQRKDGDPCMYLGSWDPADPWGGDGGRLYSTALAVLALQAGQAYPTRFPCGREVEPSVESLAPRELGSAVEDPWLDPHVRGRLMETAANRRADGIGSVLARQLANREAALRAYAARAAGALGPEAASLVAPLLERLGDDYEVVRLEAAVALGRLRPDAARTTPYLVALLADRRPAVRAEAVRSLAAVAGKGAVDSLRARLEDEDGEVRVAAARALFEVTRAVPASLPILLSALSGGSERVRVAALDSIEAIGGQADDRVREALRPLVADPSTNVALRAAEVLLAFDGASGLRKGPDSSRLLGGLKELLDGTLESEDPIRSARGVRLLARLGAGSRRWIPKLGELAANAPSATLRLEAVRALGALGKNAAAAVSALYLAAYDVSATVADAAKSAIEQVGASSGTEVPGLVEALDESRTAARARAALRSLGQRAAPRLVVALSSDDPDIRKKSARVLFEIGAPAVPALVRALDRKHEVPHRLRAGVLLGRMNVSPTHLAAAAPGLVDLLPHARSDLNVVQTGIVRIGRPAVPHLLAGVKSESRKRRRRSIETIGMIQPPADQVLSTLVAALGDDDDEVAATAAAAIGRFGPKARRSASALVAALGRDDPEIRAAAARALGRLGPGAASALPALLAAARDEDETVSGAAGSALGCLEGASVPADQLPPLDQLVADLGSADVATRRAAAASLSLWEGGAAGALDRLLSALSDEDDAVARYAEAALARIGQPAVPSLTNLVKAGSSRRRPAAMRALGRMGAGAGKAAPALATALAAGTNRREAQAALGRIGKPAARCLSKLVTHEAKDVRAAAAEALAAMGADGKSARSALSRAAKTEPDAAVRTRLFEALGSQGSSAAATVKGLLGPRNRYGARRQAAETLGGMGGDGKGALSTVRGLARKETNPDVRSALERALPRIESGAPNVYAPRRTEKTCERSWRAMDATLPPGIDAEPAALYVFDGSPDSLRDRSDHGNDLLFDRGRIRYITEPTSGLTGLELGGSTRLVTADVPRGIATQHALTVEVLLRSADPQAYVLAVDRTGDDPGSARILWSLAAHKGRYVAFHETKKHDTAVATFDAVPVDEVVLLTLTRDAWGRTYTLYRNGVVAGSMRAGRGPHDGTSEAWRLRLGYPPTEQTQDEGVDLEGVVLAIRITPAEFDAARVRAAWDGLRAP